MRPAASAGWQAPQDFFTASLAMGMPASEGSGAGRGGRRRLGAEQAPAREGDQRDAQTTDPEGHEGTSARVL